MEWVSKSFVDNPQDFEAGCIRIASELRHSKLCPDRGDLKSSSIINKLDDPNRGEKLTDILVARDDNGNYQGIMLGSVSDGQFYIIYLCSVQKGAGRRLIDTVKSIVTENPTKVNRITLDAASGDIENLIKYYEGLGFKSSPEDRRSMTWTPPAKGGRRRKTHRRRVKISRKHKYGRIGVRR